MSQKCKGTAKSTGKRCGALAMNGRDNCYYHGGPTPVGVAAPAFIHGRYSKQLPERLAARYQAALEDPQLVSNLSEIALVSARLEELFQKIDLHETGSLWKELAQLRINILAANQREDQGLQSALLNTILSLINRGAEDWQVWREIGTEIDRRAKLAESQSRIAKNQELSISIEKFNTFLGVMLKAIEEHVPDKNAIAAIRETVDNPIRGLLSGSTRDFGIA